MTVNRFKGRLVSVNEFGYAFIRRDDALGKDVFVHEKNIDFILKEGLKVEFEIVQGNKDGRLRADKVKVISD